MKFAIFVLGVFAYSAIVSARPNDIKNVFVEDNEIPADKKILKKGVSASFGGYQASAGLGGGPGGGGLFASAGIPEAGASAGVGGYGNAGASAGASSGFDYGQQRPPLQNGNGNGFFDRIFAIPINVLQSVNEYVKTKAQQGQGVYIENGSGSAGATASQNGVAAASASIGGTPDFNTRFAGAGSSEEASVASSQASASAGAYAGSSASAGVGSPSGFRPAGPGGKPDYDRIFNIPISALKSVNDFLNG
ncbi:glycine-rich protein 1-like isoform X2 [Planococcus citri]|uniref:glycine-rich protein 1-like isoform X2 n=1 Tax=Planococcus citri TaxID=170843 RepID=UPI0031F951DC